MRNHTLTESRGDESLFDHAIGYLGATKFLVDWGAKHGSGMKGENDKAVLGFVAEQLAMIAKEKDDHWVSAIKIAGSETKVERLCQTIGIKQPLCVELAASEFKAMFHYRVATLVRRSRS